MQDLYRWFLSLNIEDGIALMGVVSTMVFTVFGGIWKLVMKIRMPERDEQRRKLYLYARKRKILQKKESLFFQEKVRSPRKFFEGMDIEETDISKTVHRLRGSYLITGEAGCGKSAALQNDFRKAVGRQRVTRFFRGSRQTVYFDAEILINFLKNTAKRKAFLEQLNEAKLSKLFLYVDGVDELTDLYIQDFHEFFADIKSVVRETEPRFSCRTEFADQYLRSYYFQHHYQIKKWNPENLQKLAKCILKRLREIDAEKIKNAKAFLKNEEMRWDFIDSPLLLKLLIYIKLYSQQDFRWNENRFAFYTLFFQTLITVFQGRTGGHSFDVDSEILDQAADSVFQAYTIHEKKIPYTNFLQPLLKPLPDEKVRKVSLIHETFYEYLVSFHYHRQYEKNSLSKELIEVMKVPYSNDYADFITDAFRNDDIDKQVTAVHRMGRLYSYTLLPQTAEKFRKEFYNTEFAEDRGIQSCLDRLKAKAGQDDNPFLILKNDILFRLGRFSEDTVQDYRIRILKFAYENDTNTGAVSDDAYFAAVFKRGCAISASFLGGEQIELDYIRHMLRFLDQYDENYDLANRSHTLVYYADVSGASIFTFRDKPAEYPWDRARQKRVGRLAFPLPDRIADMDARQKKKYYFRVFDLATIYTFLKSRPGDRLSSEEIKVLRNVKIEFTDMSEERRELLRLIRTETLKLAGIDVKA